MSDKKPASQVERNDKLKSTYADKGYVQVSMWIRATDRHLFVELARASRVRGNE
jgi:hypothetical protein